MPDPKIITRYARTLAAALYDHSNREAATRSLVLAEARKLVDQRVEKPDGSLFRKNGETWKIASVVLAQLEFADKDGSMGWPWCEACQSWHHPENPTCKARTV